MQKMLTAVIIVVSLSSTSVAQDVRSSSISGAIVGDDGKPIANAMAAYRKLAVFSRAKDLRLTKIDPGFSGTIIAGPDGMFSISGLPAGEFHVCAQGVKTTHLNACVFDGVPLISLSREQVVKNVIYTVHDGGILTIRVNDPDGLIQTSKGALPHNQRFLIGVRLAGMYVRAHLLASTPTQKLYAMAIPKQGAARIFIDTDLTVTDSLGNVVHARSLSALQPLSLNAEAATLELIVK